MSDSITDTVADVPLLKTKLHRPDWQSDLVSRPTLVERLHDGTERTLTLLSAPAGYGKTTLLAEWLAETPAEDPATAWVSLDQGDNAPTVFWTYVITALQQVAPDVGERALSLLHSPQPARMELVLTTLINDVDAVEKSLALVIETLETDKPDVIDTGSRQGRFIAVYEHGPCP